MSNALGARGGKVLPGIRIAFPVCDEVKPLHVEFGNGKPTWEGYVKRYGQIHQYIENELDDGLKHLKQVLQKNILENPIPPEKDNSFYRNNIRNGATDLLFADNNLTPKKLAANVAELADCDMVCEHWAYCNDFICTCDISKGQGCSGILHSENIKRLNKKFTILVRSPNELAAEIK